MQKKLLLGICIVLTIFVITGCSKGVKEIDEKTGKERNVFTCSKKGIKKDESTSGTSWTEDITFTAKVDNDGKLIYYSTLYHYMYNSKEDCDHWCDIKVDWNNEINDNHYSGGHRETTCACEKKELEEKYIYDDIANLASILRSDIRDLNDDNTFNLDAWIENREKYEYVCN